MKQPENYEQDGNSKFLIIKNYFKCKWIKLSNQRAQNGWKCLKKHTHNYKLPPKHSLQLIPRLTFSRIDQILDPNQG